MSLSPIASEAVTARADNEQNRKKAADNGVTVVLWKQGKYLVWVATCVYGTGFAARTDEDRKRFKYTNLMQDFAFCGENFWFPGASRLLANEFLDRLVDTSGDHKDSNY